MSGRARRDPVDIAGPRPMSGVVDQPSTLPLSDSMTSQIAESIDQLIKYGVAQLMKANGFSRSGRTFHRAEGEDWQVVNLQASQSNVGEIGRFTINLGVYLPRISVLAGKPVPGKPKEYECTHRERIGRCMAGGLDQWWEINASTDLQVF